MAAKRRRRRKTKRVYVRDSRGRFASTGAVASEDAKRKRKRRRRATVAGSAVAATVAGSQVRPASRTRTAVQRRRLVRRHAARAEADHARLASIRARVLPTSVMPGHAFDAKAVRKSARKHR